MITTLRKLFRPRATQPAQSVPDGERVYAVGDIHGRADLFAALIAAIETDDAARAIARTSYILLGDLVDRGPDSAGVIRLARDWSARRGARLIAGNHEEMFLQSMDDSAILKQSLRHGGRETVLSYPINRDAWNAADLDEARDLMSRSIPADDLEYLRQGEDMIQIGDFLFVHAGIAPGVPLDQQTTSALRWIREPFLNWRESHGPVVVHGHTITPEPEVRTNRIGIDTGAYASGRLTALGLEGSRRWFVVACESADGTIMIETRNIA
jgi:serine/threonine protein phosphatase 1